MEAERYAVHAPTVTPTPTPTPTPTRSLALRLPLALSLALTLTRHVMEAGLERLGGQLGPGRQLAAQALRAGMAHGGGGGGGGGGVRAALLLALSS